MYSRIPMPQVEWKEENRRYALCFFPLIGVVIGGLLMLVMYLAQLLDVGAELTAAVCVFVPIIVTGGIHIDGFCDVSDALGCCGSREKMLEVMKDSRIGAFAVINFAAYMLLQFGAFCQVFLSDQALRICGAAAVGSVLSRAYSGLAAVTFRSAVKQGSSLQSFAKPAHRNITIAVELIYIVLCSIGMIVIYPMAGGFAAAAALGAFIFYRGFSYKKFGGITGDLAGWFLQICELAVLICAVVGDRIYTIIK